MIVMPVVILSVTIDVSVISSVQVEHDSVLLHVEHIVLSEQVGHILVMCAGFVSGRLLHIVVNTLVGSPGTVVSTSNPP